MRSLARMDRVLDKILQDLHEIRDRLDDLETVATWNLAPRLASGQKAKSSLRALANEIRRGAAEANPRGSE